MRERASVREMNECVRERVRGTTVRVRVSESRGENETVRDTTSGREGGKAYVCVRENERERERANVLCVGENE